MLFLVLSESCGDSSLIELGLAHAIVVYAICSYVYTRLLLGAFYCLYWFVFYFGSCLLLLRWHWIQNDHRVLHKPIGLIGRGASLTDAVRANLLSDGERISALPIEFH